MAVVGKGTMSCFSSFTLDFFNITAVKYSSMLPTEDQAKKCLRTSSAVPQQNSHKVVKVLKETFLPQPAKICRFLSHY